MKRSHLWLILILMITVFVVFINQIRPDDPYITESETIYSDPWRSPFTEEITSISKSFTKNNIKGCGDYFIKTFKAQQYLVACTSDNIEWKYYVVYSNMNKVYLANSEMIKKLSPPVIKK
ncbi:hypothetical protein [Aquimarina macrocephali]|uniref:hypothetical protein n=1 Tax=Aquimarina macrocephali TaxID=666563 RepID=UPI003F66C2A2